MQCPRCQHENEAGASFCEECAAPLGRTCANCGRQLSPTANFCPGCAHATGLAATPPTAQRFASPEAYTPKHLAERILTSKAALEGERKLVTVLFADLKGSMELLTDRDPEEARKILDPVLERMIEAVHRYEGTVNQVMGDGIMALFGAPLAHEDHAVRACYAALRMQEQVKSYAEAARRAHGVIVQIRVGLNSGEVVVRAIGSDLHMDYTAVGHTTHLAARMEQLATPGTILLTADTLRFAEGYVEVTALGPTPVKGLGEPVEVYEVAGATAARTRFQAAAARGLTRFVGRQVELDQLRGALESAGKGHGQVVAVVGEAGVGKSRLFYEFTHSHRLHEWLILEAGSVSYGKATAYLPVIDVLKAYFKIHDRDDHREIREKVTGKLLTLDRSLEALLPAFLGLLDVPVDDAQWQALDPPRRRQQTLEAVKRLVLRESQQQTVLLIFEDLHWIDGETQALLDGLIDSLNAARLMLLVNYRPEYQHGWGSKTYYTQHRLDALPPATAAELLHTILGEEASLDPLKQLLIKRGNPFFIEESVRTLVETGTLSGTPGRYRLTTPVQTIQVPATVQAILMARIDRLPAEEKRLLQAAAVVGKDVPYPLLQAVAELSEERLRLGLARLQAAEFVYETRLFPDVEYTFKHALTHEVAYGTVLHERRRALHARLTEAIEGLYPERLTEHVERLGEYAFRGEAWQKAAAYLREAGTKAFTRSANREAVAFFERALEALRHLPEDRDTTEQAIDLRFDLRNALIPLGEIDRMFEYLREAEHLSAGLKDQRRQSTVSTLMAYCLYMRGDHELAIEAGRRALDIGAALGDIRLAVPANTYLGYAYQALGDYRQAVAFHRTNVALLDDDLIGDRFGLAAPPSVLCRYSCGVCLAELGDFGEGVANAEEALRIAAALEQPFSLSIAYMAVGRCYLHKGDLQVAIRRLEQGFALCREWNLWVIYTLSASPLALAYALSGRVTEALRLLEEFMNRREINVRAFHLASFSETSLLAARIPDAIRLGQRALEISRQRNERGGEAYARRVLGEIASQGDPPDVARAAAFYGDAIALADELGMRPLAAHSHLGLGKLYRRTDKHHEAQDHLTAATTMYREMGMAYWLDRAEAEMPELT